MIKISLALFHLLYFLNVCEMLQYNIYFGMDLLYFFNVCEMLQCNIYFGMDGVLFL